MYPLAGAPSMAGSADARHGTPGLPVARSSLWRQMSVPLFDTKTPLAPLRDALHAKAVEVLDAGRYILGPEVTAFEEELAAHLATPHAIGVANGTDALVLAL